MTDEIVSNRTILKYSAGVGGLYVVMVLATWLIFGRDDATFFSALTGSVVYFFYLAIVFGAVTLACVVALLLRRERDVLTHPPAGR